MIYKWQMIKDGEVIQEGKAEEVWIGEYSGVFLDETFPWNHAELCDEVKVVEFE